VLRWYACAASVVILPMMRTICLSWTSWLA
jgi:hypothetical protein